MSAEEPPSGSGQWFATTHWSVVLAAGAGDATKSSAALETLCRTYWPPIYGFVRRLGHAPHDAQDLTQEFFSRLLERNQVSAADPERGRFRNFLLITLKHFLNDQHKWNTAQKRGGGSLTFSIDDEESGLAQLIALAASQSPEREFDRRWALALLERALDVLRRECGAAGKARLFESLRPFLEQGTRHGEAAKLAAELGLTPNAMAVSIHRLRARYRELVREEIAAIVSSPDQVEDELRYLIAALS